MGNRIMYIDPVGLDAVSTKKDPPTSGGNSVPLVTITRYYYNPFLEYLTAEQEAKMQAGLLTGYELLSSGSKRPLTPEE